MLEKQRRVTSNFLLHDDEDTKFDREQIYVPLALVERRKPDKKECEHSPEAGTKLYEPQYEEKQRFEHEAFLQQILEKGESKTKGKRIALIGEPGAGKTTLLQTIAFWVLEKDLGLPIWISLADLGRNENLIDFQTYLFDVWLAQAIQPSQKDIAKQELETQIQQGRVWLLLDGIDEVAASGVQILQHLSQQLTGWLAQSRVLLTCRLNVWQAADLNVLSEFETYRLLDFDYPQQVHQFINNWFVKQDVGKSERLKTELDNPNKARLRDLIQNPLRLTLLCSSWQSNEANLPDTKAELYAQFVRQFYQWKYNRFPINIKQQEELNQALGKLALKDIDESGSRFRLRESFISEKLGYPDEGDSPFYLALQLGWLNCVGIAAESSTKEKVYAFFHPTFEEYFAACAIDDWDFFLPRDHVDKPVEDKKRYRIFEPQWKEVILLWLGQSEEKQSRQQKESFIKALVEFDDRCGEWLSQERVDKGFYEYRAYFLAAAGITEFGDCSIANEIVEQIVQWGYGYLDENQKQQKFLNLIEKGAKEVLQETEHTKAIAALVKLLESTQDEYTLLEAVESLGEIGTDNAIAVLVAVLVQLLESTQDKYILLEAAESLGKIGTGNQTAIAALVALLGSNQDEYTRWTAAESLGKIGTGKETAIAALVQLLKSTQDKWTRMRAAESLVKIWSPNNLAKVVAALKDSLNDSQRFNECYDVIWHCTQNMTYPAFYQAWHKDTLDTSAT